MLYEVITNYKKYTVVEPAETFYKKAKILAKGYPNVVVKKDYFNYSFINQNADKYNYVILRITSYNVCYTKLLRNNEYIFGYNYWWDRHWSSYQ